MNSDNGTIHVPVLLKEAIHHLQIRPDGVYVDCTLGDGGYSKAIFDGLKKGRVVSLDCDDVAVAFVEKKYAEDLQSGRWKIIRENFAKLTEALNKEGVMSVDGVVFDLGLSSRQLDDDPHKRGFSYLRDQKLDMRMDTRLGVSASDLVMLLGPHELEQMFIEYGEERYSKRIAKALKMWIAQNPDRYFTSDVLAALVRKVVPAGYRTGSKHPARRVFQALRIAVNDELRSLQKGLSSALTVVAVGGRVVVVSYHSLEDRIVKDLFEKAREDGRFRLVNEKPVLPEREEIELNSRAGSAKLRAVERIR